MCKILTFSENLNEFKEQKSQDLYDVRMQQYLNLLKIIYFFIIFNIITLCESSSFIDIIIYKIYFLSLSFFHVPPSRKVCQY